MDRLLTLKEDAIIGAVARSNIVTAHSLYFRLRTQPSDSPYYGANEFRSINIDKWAIYPSISKNWTLRILPKENM